MAGLKAEALLAADAAGTASAGWQGRGSGFERGDARLERRDAGVVVGLQGIEFGAQRRGIVIGSSRLREHGEGDGNERREGLETRHGSPRLKNATPAARGGRSQSASDEGRWRAGAECPEGRGTCLRSGGLGDDGHPGDRTGGQVGRGDGDRVLQLRGCEAGAAIARRAQLLRGFGERVRIEVDFGAELRDEQGQGQPPSDQPDAFAIQLQSPRYRAAYHNGFSRPRTRRA